MNESTLPKKRLVSRKFAMDYLEIGSTKLWELEVAEEIETVRIGRAKRFVLDSLDSYIDRQIEKQRGRG